MTYLEQIDRATGAGVIPQAIQDTARAIALAESNAELLRLAKQFQNLVLIAACGAQINHPQKGEHIAALRTRIGGESC